MYLYTKDCDLVSFFVVVNLLLDIHFTCNWNHLNQYNWRISIFYFIHTSNVIRCPREITCEYVTSLAVLFYSEPGDISLLTVKLLNHFVPPPERDYCVTRVVVQSGVAERWLLLKQTDIRHTFSIMLCEKENFFITAFICALSGHISLNFNIGLQCKFRRVVMN